MRGLAFGIVKGEKEEYYQILINYDTNRSDSYKTEVNMNDIVKRIKEAGLDELVYDSEEENEESND